MKLLFVQLGRIGDMILATPMFRCIKEFYPESKIFVITGRHNFEILRNNPRLEEIFIFRKSPLKFLNFINKIRSHRFGYLIDPKDHYSNESRLIAQISRAAIKIGYNRPAHKIYDYEIPGSDRNSGMHYVSRCFNALVPLGIDKPEGIPLPELFTSPDSDKYVRDFLSFSEDRKIAVINISASAPGKMWHIEKWAKLIGKMDNNKFLPVISCAMKERKDAEYLNSLAGNALLFNSRNFRDVISLVKTADILLTPDTSLVHAAAAFNKPLFGLYGGLDEFYAKFYPLSEKYCVVRAEKGMNGIENIDADEAINSLMPFLSEIF